MVKIKSIVEKYGEVYHLSKNRPNIFVWAVLSIKG